MGEATEIWGNLAFRRITITDKGSSHLYRDVVQVITYGTLRAIIYHFAIVWFPQTSVMISSHSAVTIGKYEPHLLRAINQ